MIYNIDILYFILIFKIFCQYKACFIIFLYIYLFNNLIKKSFIQKSPHLYFFSYSMTYNNELCLRNLYENYLLSFAISYYKFCIKKEPIFRN